MTKIYDMYGQERDPAWLLDRFGPVTVEGSSDRFYVELLREVEGPTSMTVTIRDKNGSPIDGQAINFGWPDGEVTGHTDVGGAVGFGMGGGAYYFPPNKGPHYVIVDELRVEGLGMLGGTNHIHIEPTFREWDSGAPPPVEPPPDPPEPPPEPPPTCEENWDALFDKLDTIIWHLEAM